MTFTRRLTLLSGGAVAVAILLASALAYVTIARQLRDLTQDERAVLRAAAPILQRLA